MRIFQFKFIHRKIATQHFLCKIGISECCDCNFCESYPQTLNHLFLKCKFVCSLWNDIYSWLKSNNIRQRSFTDEEICFGTLILDQFYLINTVILHAKYFIFSCKYQNTIPKFKPFLLSIRHLERTERIIALNKDRLEFHETKWQAFKS